MDDRRRHRRVHVISYLKVQETGTEKHLGRAFDISVKGLGLYGPDPLEPDTEVQLCLSLPKPFNGKEQLEFEGRVVWSALGEHPGFFDSGVELFDTEEDDIKLLEDFIERSAIEDRWLSLAEIPEDA